MLLVVTTFGLLSRPPTPNYEPNKSDELLCYIIMCNDPRAHFHLPKIKTYIEPSTSNNFYKKIKQPDIFEIFKILRFVYDGHYSWSDSRWVYR